MKSYASFFLNRVGLMRRFFDSEGIDISFRFLHTIFDENDLHQKFYCLEFLKNAVKRYNCIQDHRLGFLVVCVETQCILGLSMYKFDFSYFVYHIVYLLEQCGKEPKNSVIIYSFSLSSSMKLVVI